MEFRRINGLPPYVFAIINELRDEARHGGRDVIDMGFGNPDIPSPEIAVEKLAEAARNPRNHRYSASRGIPKLRLAISNLYLRKWGVEVDPDTEIVATIGAKEGLSHLMWTLLGPGDTTLVPTPSTQLSQAILQRQRIVAYSAACLYRSVPLHFPGSPSPQPSPRRGEGDNLAILPYSCATPRPRFLLAPAGRGCPKGG